MEVTKGFYDLCVPWNNDRKLLKNLLIELAELGYKTIAIEQIFDHTKKMEKRSNDIFPVPENLEFLKEFEKKLKILQRLTIIYSDVSVSHAMSNSPNVKKYNLIAAVPATEAAFNHSCTTFKGDIICFNPEDPKYIINRKTFQVAVKRGIFFEIKYSALITNSSLRKNMIKISHNYHQKCKSKNIIFSSGAKNIFELRGPYDISNLALIFGLSEEQGKNSVLNSCRQVCSRAESRRIGKTSMYVKNINSPNTSSSSSTDDSDNDEMEVANEPDKSSINSTSSNSTDNDDDFTEQPQKKSKLS